MRWAMVASLERKARAISSVVSPPIRRRVRAARASVDNTGWQAVKIRLRRSSPTSSSIAASMSSIPVSRSSSRSRPISACLRASIRLRRNPSMARRLAAAISQAPGLFGTPVCGHSDRAITRASCASSSARPTSRTIRARPAISLARSIRNTVSITRWVSVAATFPAYGRARGKASRGGRRRDLSGVPPFRGCARAARRLQALGRRRNRPCRRPAGFRFRWGRASDSGSASPTRPPRPCF